MKAILPETDETVTKPASFDCAYEAWTPKSRSGRRRSGLK